MKAAVWQMPSTGASDVTRRHLRDRHGRLIYACGPRGAITRGRSRPPSVRPRDRRSEAMVKPIPDGYPRVTPYLIVDGASAAIDFYTSVLGATERVRMAAPDDKVGHA